MQRSWLVILGAAREAGRALSRAMAPRMPSLAAPASPPVNASTPVKAPKRPPGNELQEFLGHRLLDRRKLDIALAHPHAATTADANRAFRQLELLGDRALSM